MSKFYWETVILKQTVASQGTVSSSPIDVSRCQRLAYKITVVSGTTPKIKLRQQVIESGEGDSNFVGGAKDVKNGFGWLAPNTNAILVSEITSGSEVDGFIACPTNWLRLQAIGNAGNGVNPVVTVKIGRWYE